MEERCYALKLPAKVVFGHDMESCCIGTIYAMSSSLVHLNDLSAPLEWGKTVQVWIDWPAVLEDGTGLRLFITGEVQSIQDSKAIVSIKRHRFHTRSLKAKNASYGAL